MRKKPSELRPERAKCLNGETAVVPADADGESQFPLLYDLLIPRYKEGIMTRAAATLSVKALGGCYRVSVTASTEAVAATFLVKSLSSMWQEIEACLASGSTVWLPDYESQKKARQALRK